MSSVCVRVKLEMEMKVKAVLRMCVYICMYVVEVCANIA